jgi:hypothetical protein
MSKFEKKILKGSKNHRNCLVVGTGLGMMPDIIEYFQNIFIIDKSLPRIRNMKVVYREDFENLLQLHDVDFVFLDYEHHKNLNRMRELLLKCRPVIFVKGDIAFPVEDYKYLNSLGFALVDISKNMQKWTPK